MRPDEHKKRKNAQYKKKHNINNDGKSSSKESCSKRTSSSKQGPENVERSALTNVEDSGCEVNSDRGHFENGIDGKDRKVYQRRKLESNWSRYRELSSDEDDIPTQRGEDFNKLFAQAGGSSAQFRFKDEEEWQDSQGELAGGLLNLDVDLLAEAVQCIPLFDRLALEESFFSEEQKNEMVTMAMDKKSVFHDNVEKRRKQKVQSKVLSCSNDKSDGTEDSLYIVNDVKLSSMNSTCEHSERTVTTEKHRKPQEAFDLEDDLDRLLSQDEPAVETSDRDKIKPEQNKQPLQGNIVKPSNGLQSSSGGAGVGSKDILEDWLDDLLDND